jgi:hypothetical protein
MAAGSNQHKVFAIIIITACFTVGTLSVTGLLQSTETFSSSGVIVAPSLPPAGGGGSIPSSPSPPPPEPTVEIDIYSDQACTQALTNIVWGEIEAGDSSSKTIHVKNNGETGVVLSLETENWTPGGSQDHMSLNWDYDGASISAGQVETIMLTLSVSGSAPPMPLFNFDIVIIGS